ncbi:MAG: response regulator [Acidobacteria bacterium]|nr:response regulator [Acidobacteriota bacterium]
MPAQLDAETVAGFLEEARSYVPPLEDCVVRLRERGFDERTLQEAHRLVHLIRGGAAVVGISGLPALGEEVEGFLEDRLNGVIEWDEDSLVVLEEAVAVMRLQLMGAPQGKSPEVSAIPITADPEMLEGFLLEAEEALGEVSLALGEYAANNKDHSALLRARRGVHTIKGAGAMVGLPRLSGVAHRMEDLLDAVDEGLVSPSATVMGLLRKTIDVMVGMVAAGGDREEGVAELLALYENAASSQTPLEPVLLATPVEPAIPKASFEALETEVAEGPRTVRVPMERIEDLQRMATEIFVHQSTYERTLNKLSHELGELALSVRRLRQVQSSFEQEHELYYSGAGPAPARHTEFDALELDRYTQLYTHSRDLGETAADFAAAEAQMQTLAGELDSLMSWERRLHSQVQDKLLRFRLVPLGTLTARLDRTVRAAGDLAGKQTEFILEGGATELDKAMVEALTGPLEHLARNAVAHGLESEATRAAAGKPATGRVVLRASQEGGQVVLRLSDDGGGLRVDKIRARATELGWDSSDVSAVLFRPGFSTADEVSPLAGRGLGLDVVKSAVESLKGTLEVESEAGLGTVFTLRLPLTVAVSRVLMMETRGQLFGLPIDAVAEVKRVVGGSEVVELGDLLGLPMTGDAPQSRSVAVLREGGERSGLAADTIREAREVVVKPLSKLVRKSTHLAGATLLGDGRVVPILNPVGLTRIESQRGVCVKVAAAKQAFDILIVDDSLSVRRVITKLLERQNWTTSQAKDGIEALEMLRRAERLPDLILMDVEMPRMDGFELTATLRAEAKFAGLPIVMLTSRSGDKHRTKAFDAGVTEYLVKPYQDEQLLRTISMSIQSKRNRSN